MRECEGRFDYLSRGPGIRGGEVVHSYSYHHHPLGDRLEYLADPTFPKPPYSNTLHIGRFDHPSLHYSRLSPSHGRPSQLPSHPPPFHHTVYIQHACSP